MLVLANIFVLIGLTSLVVGSIWLVVQAFKKSIWWGVVTTALFPIFVFVFPFVKGRLSIRPSLLIWGGLVLLFAGGGGQQGSIGAIIFGGVTLVGMVYGYSKSKVSEVSSGRSAISIEGIIFDSSRFDDLLKRERQLFADQSKLPKAKSLVKLFKNEDFVAALRNFNQKHFIGLISNKSKGPIKWQDEHSQLFLEMMRRKYQLGESQVISALLYVNDEDVYTKYADTFDNTIASSPRTFMQEVVLSDIYTGNQPNFPHIIRLAGELKVRLGRQGVERQYSEVKQEIKLLQFEKNLADSSTKTFQSIEKQIKTEKQIEAINSRIATLLNLEPTDYVIVGPDYSRDSRIDNYYKSRFSYVLSKAFGGHCCRCQEGMGQLEFDHFWWPKSRGGNFLMRSKNGVYVNNCIPLCRSCNASKSNKDFREFFTESEISRIIEISQSINVYINEEMIDFSDPEFIGRSF